MMHILFRIRYVLDSRKYGVNYFYLNTFMIDRFVWASMRSGSIKVNERLAGTVQSACFPPTSWIKNNGSGYRRNRYYVIATCFRASSAPSNQQMATFSYTSQARRSAQCFADYQEAGHRQCYRQRGQPS